MRRYLDDLAQYPLFQGSSAEQIEAMLSCLSAHLGTAKRRAFLYRAGEEATALGLVLQGHVDIVQEDFWGNQGILARLAPGDIFAESFALAQGGRMPVSAVAVEPSTVLMLDVRRVLKTCPNSCAFHDRLIENLLTILATKNIALTQKIEIVTRRTMREKLLAYLSSEAQKAGASRFTIPYDRQALADYLAVDRSALSRTLGEMQREGLLTYRRSTFALRQPQAMQSHHTR